MSILYGNFPVKNKEKIMDKIGNEFIDEFMVGSIHLFNASENDENLWGEIAEFKVLK